jgi:hypothetical protein
LVKSDLVRQFDKAKDWMRKLNLTVPFTKEITQIPAYAKRLKKIISKDK